jgi:hypothetical protein
MDDSAPKQRMLPFWDNSCAVCRTFDPNSPDWIGGLRDAVSPDRDLFCNPHRARAEEGSCVLCGRRLPWKHIGSERRPGFCLPCLDQPEDPRKMEILQFLRELPATWEMSE